MPTLQQYYGGYLWKYIPNLPAAVIFATLFFLATIAHTWKMLKYRTWYCSAFVIGGICTLVPTSYQIRTPKRLSNIKSLPKTGEIIDYTSRIFARYNTGSLAPFLIQAITILLAPILFAGGLYIVYGRIVRAVHGEPFSPLSPKLCTWIFLIGDQLCLNIQSAGAGLLPKDGLQNVANGIIISGLALQIILFVGFMWCCVRFHTRFRAHLASSGKVVNVKWEEVLYMLYGTSVLVSIRNVYRLVDFTMGTDGYLSAHEWPLYVVDGGLMLLVMAIFSFWYPPQLDERRSVEHVQLVSGGNSYNAGREGYAGGLR